jgi:lysophospholipase L1-like esterase
MRLFLFIFPAFVLSVTEGVADPLRFTFSSASAGDGAVYVPVEAAMTAAAASGFSGPAPRHLQLVNGRAVVFSDEPFFFHVRLPEGNYRVRAMVGGLDEPTSTTIKAETRRLMAKDIRAGTNQTVEVEFAVNIRRPALPKGGQVALRPREVGVLHWDEFLTLEFGGERPALAGLEIASATDVITVYLAGDSTVTDQAGEPWCGWGQMLPPYFRSSVAVANHAESGLSVRSFIAQRRLEKILTTLQPGDYVFVQFGHNDQKETGEGIGPFDSYSGALRSLASQVREGGGHPVFVTSMYRRRFTGREIQDTLGDYPRAMRRLAAELKIPLVDLHAGSRVIFEALGPEVSKKAFVHYPANTFAGQTEALGDDSHFSTYGGNLLARWVVEAIRGSLPGLAAHLVEGLPGFDPESPPPPEEWRLSPSPPGEFARPEGS